LDTFGGLHGRGDGYVWGGVMSWQDMWTGGAGVERATGSGGAEGRAVAALAQVVVSDDVWRAA